MLAYAYLKADSPKFSGLIQQVANEDAVEELPESKTTMVQRPSSSSAGSCDESAAAAAVKEVVAAAELRLERKVAEAVDRLSKEVSSASAATEAKLVSGSCCPPPSPLPPPQHACAVMPTRTARPFENSLGHVLLCPSQAAITASRVVATNPMSPPGSPPPLPHGWTVSFDTSKGAPFFTKGETATWDRPAA